MSNHDLALLATSDIVLDQRILYKPIGEGILLINLECIKLTNTSTGLHRSLRPPGAGLVEYVVKLLHWQTPFYTWPFAAQRANYTLLFLWTNKTFFHNQIIALNLSHMSHTCVQVTTKGLWENNFGKSLFFFVPVCAVCRVYCKYIVRKIL